MESNTIKSDHFFLDMQTTKPIPYFEGSEFAHSKNTSRSQSNRKKPDCVLLGLEDISPVLYVKGSEAVFSKSKVSVLEDSKSRIVNKTICLLGKASKHNGTLKQIKLAQMKQANCEPMCNKVGTKIAWALILGNISLASYGILSCGLPKFEDAAPIIVLFTLGTLGTLCTSLGFFDGILIDITTQGIRLEYTKDLPSESVALGSV